MRTLRFSFVMALCAGQACAQYLSPQQDPPAVDWKCIQSPHYEIVFPSDIARDGQRVASMLEHLYQPVAKTLAIEPRRITVILTNNTTQANGFVTLAPRRSEWFGTPPPHGLLGTNDWYTLLAVHEMRHVAQFDKLDAGFTGFMSWWFGETMQSFFSFWSVPGWVWEGDAVGTETALTAGGRGRMPEFDRDIRTLLLSGERYSYYKAFLGSFKDWYPSQYHLGGLLTTRIKRAYGPERFAEIMRRSANWSFLPFAWSWMSNSEIDRTTVEVYEETMDEVTALWKKQEAALVLTRGSVMNRQSRDCWTNYLFPQYLADGSIVAQKWGLDDIYTLVRIDAEGNEHELCLAALYENPMSVRGTKIVWNEPVADLRWGKRDFMRLCVYDVATDEKRVLLPESKLFSPALSPDLKTIAAVEFTPRRECAIVLLDAESGRELRRLPNPAGDFLQTPSWSPDGATLVALAVSDAKGKAVKRYDAASGAEDILLPYSHENVTSPLLHGPWLFYQSPHSGIDNVYAMHVATRRRMQVTSARFGASNPCVASDGRTLLYSNYTTQGFDVEAMPLDSTAWKPAAQIQDGFIRYYEPLVAMEAGRDMTADIPRREWEVRDYSALANLLNVHSWSVLPASTDRSVSLTLSSLNRMNTFGMDAGYDYDFNEKSGFFRGGVSYAGFFPILGASGQSGTRSTTYKDSRGTQHSTSWSEQSIRAGFTIPLNFTKGLYHMSAAVRASASHVEVGGKSVTEAWDVNNGSFTPLTYEADFSAGIQWMRDIHPRWGQFLSLAYSHAPFRGDDYKGNLFSILGTFYFPGSLPSHSIWVQAGYERQDVVNYRFASRMRFPRGYDAVFHASLFKASMNYDFPIWYPDLHLWSLLNVQRLRASIFYDMAEGHDVSQMRRYHSGGAELVTDVNLFSLPFLIDVGVRASWLAAQKKWVTEFVIGSGL